MAERRISQHSAAVRGTPEPRRTKPSSAELSSALQCTAKHSAANYWSVVDSNFMRVQTRSREKADEGQCAQPVAVPTWPQRVQTNIRFKSRVYIDFYGPFLYGVHCKLWRPHISEDTAQHNIAQHITTRWQRYIGNTVQQSTSWPNIIMRDKPIKFENMNTCN